MTTQKIDPLEVIENLPPIDPEPETTDKDSLTPLQSPQLVTKAQTSTDKQIVRKQLIA